MTFSLPLDNIACSGSQCNQTNANLSSSVSTNRAGTNPEITQQFLTSQNIRSILQVILIISVVGIGIAMVTYPSHISHVVVTHVVDSIQQQQ